MFEKSAAELVEKLCGQYVEGVDAENLKISMWKGEVTLEQVALKSTAFDVLKLPISLREGSIGRLHLQVPWSKLGSAPVTITVQDVSAVIVPRHEKPHGETLEERHARLQQDIEKQRKALLTKASDGSYLTQVLSGVVDNLIFKFERINLRYEDDYTIPGLPFVAEVGLRGLSLVTADENWAEQTFLQDQKVLHKLGQLTDLSVRWQSEASPQTPASLLPTMLQPISATLKLQLSKKESVKANRPMATIAVEMTQLLVSVDQLSLRDAAVLADSWDAQRRRALRASRRPRVPSYRGHAVEWWQFAIKEVMIGMGSGSASNVMKCARMGREYRELLKRALRVLPLPELSEQECARVIEIEDSMPSAFIQAVQRGMLVHLRQEAEDHISKSRAAQADSSIMSRWFGGAGGDGSKDSGMTAEEQKKMQELVEAAKAKEAAQAEELEHAPPEYVAYRCSFSIEGIGAEIGTRVVRARGGAEDAGKLEGLMRLEMRATRGQVLMRQRNTSVDASVGRLRIDNLAAGIRPIMWNEIKFVEPDQGGVPLLALSIDLDPLPANLPAGRPVDVVVQLDLQRSILAVDKDWLERVLAWKAALDEEKERMGIETEQDSSNAASKSINTAKQLVKRVSTRRKLVSIAANIQAPTIHVPTEYDTAVLQLGRITVKTELAESVGREERDRFLVALTDVQLLRGDPMALEGASELLAPVAAALEVGVSTVPDDPDVSQLRAALKVAGVQVKLSEQDVRALLSAASQLQLQDQKAAVVPAAPKSGSLKRMLEGSVHSLSQDLGEGFSGSVRALAGIDEQLLAPALSPQRSGPVGGDVKQDDVAPPKGMEIECEVSCLALVLLSARASDAQQLVELKVESVSFCRSTHGFATDTRFKISDFDVTHPSSFGDSADQAVQPKEVTIITAKGKEDLLELRVVQTLAVRSDQQIQDLEVSMSLGKIKFCACPPALQKVMPHIEKFGSLSEAAQKPSPMLQGHPQRTPQVGRAETKKTTADSAAPVKGSQTLTLQITSVEFRLKDVQDSVLVDVLHSCCEDVDLTFIKNRDESMRFQTLIHHFEVENELVDASTPQRKVLTAAAGNDHMATIDYSTSMRASGLARKMSAKMGRLNFNLNPDFVGDVLRLVSQLQAVVGSSSDQQQTFARSNSSVEVVAQQSTPLELEFDLAGFCLFIDRPSNPAEGVEVHIKELKTRKPDGVTSADTVCAGLRIGVAVLVDERRGEAAGKEDLVSQCHVLEIEGQVQLRRFLGASQSGKLPPDQQFKHLLVALDKVALTVEKQSVKMVRTVFVEAMSRISQARSHSDEPSIAPTSSCAMPATKTSLPADSAEQLDRCPTLVLEGAVDEFVFSFREAAELEQDALKSVKKPFQPQTLVVIARGAETKLSTFDSGAREFTCELKMLVVQCQDVEEHPASTVREEDDGRLLRRVLASEAEDRFSRKTRKMQDSMRALFRKNDDSQNSKLDVDELLTTLRELGVCFSEDQAMTLLDQLDDDKDGEINEEEFLNLVWLSLGEERPDEDVQNGDLGPSSPDAAADRDAVPFVSISHTTRESGDESFVLRGARLEVDLSLEPLGMLLRLNDFISELMHDGVAELRLKATAPPATNGVGELFGLLGQVQALKAPYEDDRSRVIVASRPPPRDVSIQLEGLEVCVTADTSEEKEPAVFLWIGRATLGSCLETAGAGWNRSMEVAVEDLEIGYVEKLIGKYDPKTRTRTDHEPLLKKNSFRFLMQQDLGVLPSGLHWKKTTTCTIDKDVELEVALSHLVFLVTYWQVLRAKVHFEDAERDREEQADGECDDSEPRDFSGSNLAASVDGAGTPAEKGESLRTQSKPDSTSYGLQRDGPGPGVAAVEAERGPRMASQSEAWSFKCGQGRCRLEVRDDLQKNVPLVKFDMGSMVLDNQVATTEAVFQVKLDVSCSMHNSKIMNWEPILERFECRCSIATSKASPTQHIELLAPTRLELSLAPEHLREIVQAQVRFQDALKQSKADLITEAPTLARFTSSKQINDDLSNFFATFTPESTRLFHNRTSLDLRLRVQSEDESKNFLAFLPPTKTASIDVNQIGLLQIQPALPSTRECAWSDLLPELKTGSGLFHVVCQVSGDSPPAHLHLRCTASEIHALAPWTLQNLLPTTATVVLHGDSDPLSPEITSVTAVPGPVLQQFGADLRDDDFYLSLKLGETLRTVKTLKIDAGAKFCEGCVRLEEELEDGDKRDLEVRVHLTRHDGGSTILRVYPQLVMVNRTGLPLLFGRCRARTAMARAKDVRESKTANIELEVQEVAGQPALQFENVHSAAGWQCREWGDGGRSWVRSAAGVKDVGGGAWNLRDPDTVLLSLPEGPEWSPCVSLAGSSAWEEIAHDDPEEGQDVGEAEGRTIKLYGPGRYCIDVDGDGTVDRVEEGQETNYSLGVTMKMGDIPFHRTIYMDFMPLHTIVNRTEASIQVVQHAGRFPQEDIILQVESGLLMSTFGAFHQAGLHDKDDLGRRLAMRYVDEEGYPLTEWSGPFKINEERTFPLRLWSAEDERDARHVVCEIRRWRHSTFINFLPHDESRPLYQVANCTDGCDVAVWQIQSPMGRNRAVFVKPQETRMLSWDDVDSLLQVGVKIGNCEPVLMYMSKLGQKGVVHEGRRHISYQCKIVGSTRCLEIKDVQQQQHFDANDALLVSAGLHFGGIGLSIVNSDREELLYASLQTVQMGVMVHDSKVVIDVSIDKMHVDNQTNEGPRKALILPVMGGNKPKLLQASAELCRDVITMPYWNTVEVQDSELCVQLQEDWLFKLLRFEQDAFNEQAAASDEGQAASLLVLAQTGTSRELEQMIRNLSFLESAEGSVEQGVHIEQLLLGAIEGDVSVYGLYAVPSREEKPSVGPVSSMYENLRVVQAPMGSVPDIHRHHIKLPELRQENVSLLKGSTLGGLMWTHYKKSLYRGAVKLMGSADFWANVLGSASDSKASALDRQKQKAMQRAHGRPETIESGIAQGFSAVSEGVWSGLTGMVEKPLEAAKDNGASGLLQGIGQGLLGAFTKPAAGVLMLGSKVTEGAVAQVKGVERVPREREPRAVYADHKLHEYNRGDAECYQALCQRGTKALGFVGYASMEGDKGLLVAQGKVHVVRKKDLRPCTAPIAFDDLEEVKWHGAECRVQLRSRGQAHPQVVTVIDRDRGEYLAEYLRKQIGDAEREDEARIVIAANGQRVHVEATSDQSIDKFFEMIPPMPGPRSS